ncbi:MAG TPA: DUF2332 domain-containing protein [Ilumatobacteraceae bacterium]|nr:DUF2332 domain-containing protein [Ilumatobacteraceae bacterium]
MTTLPRVGDAVDDLAGLWRWYADQFRGDSRIYGRIADAVAADREVLEILSEAPPAAHLPPAALAAVHYLLLDGFDHPLADVYAGRSETDPGPLFCGLCRTERTNLLALLETRRVQTNDCGRSAIIGPALTWATAHVAGPYYLIDVGASAGINLHCDRYRLDYGDHGVTGPDDSTVRVACEVTGGNPPIAERLPTFAGRVGIDRSPIDLSDPADAQWLLACVWPDTGRVERVQASIRLAQQDPVPMVAGRANDVLPHVLTELPPAATALVMTTWAFSYFSIEERAQFLDLLRDESQRRRIVWLCADTRLALDTFDDLATGDRGGAEVLVAVVFEGGIEARHLLGFVHPHGNWIDWRATF